MTQIIQMGDARNFYQFLLKTDGAVLKDASI